MSRVMMLVCGYVSGAVAAGVQRARSSAGAVLAGVAGVLGFGSVASAQGTTMPLPSIPSATATDLSAWITAMVAIAITLYFVVVNASVILWFVKATVKRFFRWV